jgi:serine phosphatase RsbU (regulator of sigma subunit)
MYRSALLAIAVLAMLSQIVIRQAIDTQSLDAKVINVAGKQSMLSQQMSKLGFTMLKSSETQVYEGYTFQEYLDEFKNLADMWSRTHKGLQHGDPVMQLPGKNSEAIAQMFQEIAPFQKGLEKAFQQIITCENLQPDERKTQLRMAMHDIMLSEMPFQELMNQITTQYEQEALLSLERLKQIELVLLAAQLILLLVLGIFVFNPAVRKIRKYFLALQEKKEELEAMNHELLASEEEIRQNAEELLAMNDNLLAIKEKLEYSLANEQKANEQLEQTHKALIKAYDFIAYKNRQIEASINYAQRIQDSVLPDRQELSSLFPESFIFYKPKDVVSGDFYWFVEKDGKAIIAAVDCMGHGVPGAFMSLISERLLHEIVHIQGISQAHLILNQLHIAFREALKQDKGDNSDSLDVAVCVVHPRHATTGEYTLEYAGARNPLWYIQGNEMYELKGDRFSIGGKVRPDEVRFTSHTLTFSEPGTFYLFSDGLQDQFGGPRGRKFSKAKFREILLESSQFTMEHQAKQLEEALQQWMVNQETGENHIQIDDIMVIGFKVA